MIASDGTIVAGGTSGGNLRWRVHVLGRSQPNLRNQRKTITTIAAEPVRCMTWHLILSDALWCGRCARFGPGQRRFAITRYNSDGTTDTTFGTKGVTLSDFNVLDVAKGVIVQPTNQKIDVRVFPPPVRSGSLVQHRRQPRQQLRFGWLSSDTLGSAAAIAYETDSRL